MEMKTSILLARTLSSQAFSPPPPPLLCLPLYSILVPPSYLHEHKQREPCFTLIHITIQNTQTYNIQQRKESFHLGQNQHYILHT